MREGIARLVAVAHIFKSRAEGSPFVRSSPPSYGTASLAWTLHCCSNVLTCPGVAIRKMSATVSSQGIINHRKEREEDDVENPSISMLGEVG